MVQRFLSELKRRKVLRVVGAYAVASWGILQAADALFPRLGLPDWTFTFVAVLLLIGLPISTIIAWAFEITPDGVRRTPEPATAPTPAPVAQSWIEPVLVVVLVAVLGVTAFQVATRSSVERPPSVVREALAPSVAVLPFASFSNDPEDGYFADGLSEELINSLTQIEGLRVPGRTSSFHFKGKNEDLREVGRQLDVAHVLEGSVRRAAQRLRITVQLVSASDGFHLWSRTYDRDLTDVFAIQQDIAAHVAAQLQRTLLPGTTGDVANVDETLASDTYPRFLIATALLRERSRDSLSRARALFEDIVAVEPENVDALAGYARATILLAGAYLTLDFEPAAEAAIDAVERALALAPDSVAANLAAGSVYDTIAFRTDEQRYLALAERALTRAVDLAPHDPEVLAAYGSLLTLSGRLDLALEVIQQAFSHDPMNRSAQLRLAEAYRGVGRLGEAKTELETLIAREPDYLAAQLELGELLIETGALAAALPYLEVAHEARTMPRATFALANVLLNLGRSEDVRRTVATLDYAPLSRPLGEMVLLMASEDEAGALAFAEAELARTGDRLWRPLVALLALNTGDLEKARSQLRALEPVVLVPNGDVARVAPVTLLLAANLLTREGHADHARDLLESLLTRYQPAAEGFDPVSSKILRAHAYAQLGRTQDVLAELRAARTQGYRTLYDFDYFLRIDRYPTFAAVRDEPEVAALIEAIDADNRAIAVDDVIATSG